MLLELFKYSELTELIQFSSNILIFSFCMLIALSRSFTVASSCAILVLAAFSSRLIFAVSGLICVSFCLGFFLGRIFGVAEKVKGLASGSNDVVGK